MISRIKQIKSFGQKIWLDNISRELLDSQELKDLLDFDGIAGITSNPTIFFKAISNDSRYQTQLQELKQQNLDPLECYEQLAITDIKKACELLLPLYVQSNTEDGYVSLEVSPELANDTYGTITSAIQLWEEISHPNLMIKVPATKEGILAFEELIKKGINVNITLLFSLDQVREVWNAYIRGLEYRLQQGVAIDRIKAVASFFLSRIDSAIDDILPTTLQGKTALNLSYQAYREYLDIFHGERFAKLRAAGAKGQYLLWASTGTKNPQYSDVLYIEELIGSETINTVPDATLNAFRDHGVAKNTLTSDKLNNAAKILEHIEEHISLELLGKKLQQAGLNSFKESFNQLIELVK